MKIKVDIFMDYACPFCYIGHAEFENAIKALNYEDKIIINYKSFQLDRTAPDKPKKMEKDSLIEKYGNKDQVENNINMIVERGKSLGLEFNFDKIYAQNTFKAHVIHKLAIEKGLGSEYQKLAFKYLFTDGMFLADNNILIKLASEIGITKDEVLKALEKDSKYEKEVKMDLLQASHYKLSGVPFFIYNGKYSIKGAQNQGMFERILKHIEEESEEN